MNFQRTPIKKSKLRSYAPPTTPPYRDIGSKLERKVERTWKLLAQSKRPVLVSGGGVRLAKGVQEIHKLAKLTGFPVITSWSGFDSFGWEHPQLVGCHGVYGSRAANFSVQNSDVLLTVGSRLDTRQTGGRPNMYARNSKLVMVDIDKAELDKRRGLTPAIAIQTDAKQFLAEMIKQYPKFKHDLPDTSSWTKKTQDWKVQYPIVKPEYYETKGHVDPYVFGEMLSSELDSDAIVIPDEGGHLTWLMQSFKLKQGQRLFSAFGNSPMGYAFPAAIGASIARGRRDIICIDGDGGFQFNIQEMQTMVAQKIPLKIFIYNNEGYGIIRQFQKSYLDNHLIATTNKTGVTNPDYKKIAKSYEVPFIRIHNHQEMRRKIRKALSTKGSIMVEIMMDPKQEIMPKLAFGNPLEDQWPLLPRKELKKNMIIPMVGADKTLTEAN
jgi:acetolactate synthase-1/2/3 large subunit